MSIDVISMRSKYFSYLFNNTITQYNFNKNE